MSIRSRRLPGFRFETQPPPARDALPRMDIAVFVGFASSGPLHVPVAIEDPASFTSIFGDDLPLAWNQQRGEQVYAYLAPAVRAFFRCGGQRCYVIRVAGEAQTNHFALPGMAQAEVDALGNVIAVTPVSAQARSEGGWSDGLRVSTALFSGSIDVVNTAVDGTSVTLINSEAQTGDLLRLTYRGAGVMRLIVVDRVEAAEVGGVGSPPSPRRAAVRAIVKSSLWLSELVEVSPPFAITEAKMFGQVEEGEDLILLTTTRFETRNNSVLVLLHALRDLADAPPLGSMITVDVDGEHLLLSVQDVSGGDAAGSPADETIWITCAGVRWAADMPVPAELPIAERLTFELRARPTAGDPFAQTDLAFSLDHPRSWNGRPDEYKNMREGDRSGLPTDTQWFTSINERETLPTLWKQAAEPRFPLAGGLMNGDFSFPYAMSVLPDYELQPYPNDEDALTRNGLALFGTSLFLDQDLAGTTALDLAGRADYLRYLSTDARALRGIHAAMAIEEATLIAVPDAMHPGWTYDEDPTDLFAKPSEPLKQPDWSHFIDCGTRILNAPVLSVSAVDASGSFTLSWTWLPNDPLDEPVFTLEEAALPDFSDAQILYVGEESVCPLYGRARGDYYYRVRVTVEPNFGDWSNGIGVRVAPGSQWILNTPTSQTGRVTLTIHRALLRLCAARADLVAVLALPEHFREDETINHARALTPFSTLLNPEDLFDFPLSFAEEKALSYGALYHPWIYMREGAFVRSAPPDGTMCGMIARRSIGRGAWIAPANEPIDGVIALTPPLAEERLLDLLEGQINIIKPSPYGFIAQTADTLSLNDDLRPLNVRRLLILLRRLVQRQGTKYVFEPFDAVFRRMVQRSLEAVLEDMFLRGAFAGRTADAAFQVVPRSTAQDVDQGRFIMDLRVAPSLPMEFLTVRLVQSGDRSSVSEER